MAGSATPQYWIYILVHFPLFVKLAAARLYPYASPCQLDQLASCGKISPGRAGPRPALSVPVEGFWGGYFLREPIVN